MALKDLTIGELAEGYGVTVLDALRVLEEAFGEGAHPSPSLAEKMALKLVQKPARLAPEEVIPLVKQFMQEHPSEGVQTGDIRRWVEGMGRSVSSSQVRRALSQIPGVLYEGEKRFTRYYFDENAADDT